MKKDRNTSADAAELRRRAEARLRADATKGTPARTEADTQRLVHELQVHQIELEMQNEELRQSRAEVEAGLERYTELYDFAPVGYLTLGRDGAIRQVNLTGARLLGVERARLVGRRFGVFVAEPDRAGFNAFLEKVFASQAKEECEVALLKEGKGPLNVQITATVSQDGQECRVMIEDITERKQAEAETKRLASFPMLNPRPIVEVDVAGHVHFCNPIASRCSPIFISADWGIRGLQIGNRCCASSARVGQSQLCGKCISTRSGTIKRCISWKMESASASTGRTSPRARR